MDPKYPFGLHFWSPAFGVLAFFFFFRNQFSHDYALFNGSRALFTRPTNLFFEQNFH